MLSRWRPRFSVRTLLLAVVLISFLLGWISLQFADSRKQAKAVRELQRLGGTVYYDFHHFYNEDGEGGLNDARAPDDWIYARKLFGDDTFNNVYYVRFAGLTHIPQSPGRIHFLGPVDTPTNLSRDADNYIDLLVALPGLHSLDLSASNVTDEAIPTLAELKSLKWLYLKGTSISQDGISEIQKMLPECEVHWR